MLTLHVLPRVASPQQEITSFNSRITDLKKRLTIKQRDMDRVVAASKSGCDCD
jgi:hypothetical protein